MISELIVTIFNLGKIKWAPGTVGSFFSIILIFCLNYYTEKLNFIIIFFIILVIGFISISKYSKKINKIDSKEIIIDEFIGIYLIFFFYDFIIINNEILKLSLIFVLFRFFDIFKLFPANIIEKKFQNSFGVIFDDIIASIYTIITLSFLNVVL